MKTLFLLLIYYIHDSQANLSLPAPVNATLVSNNFQHILRWSPGRDTPPRTVYRIKLWKYFHTRQQDHALLQVPRHRNHTVNVSKYMKNIYADYFFQLWASLGNRSSSVVNVTSHRFCPMEMTTIGPPSVDVLGCGNCLNITIILPQGESKSHALTMYYNAIQFKLHWRKARDQEVITHMDTSGKNQNVTHAMFVYKLQNLQPQEKYCVKVQPFTTMNHNTLSSDWICAFTSKVQAGGAVTFLVIWTVVSILVGLSFLFITTSLAYSGILCKIKTVLPKALTHLVHNRYTSHYTLEEVCFSVAEFDCNTKTNKLKALLQPVEAGCAQENKEKGGSKEEEEEEEEEEEDSNYMEREAGSRDLCTTSSPSTSIFLCESANSSRGCSSEDVPVQAEEATHTQLQLHVIRDDNVSGTVGSVKQKPKPPNEKELEEEGEQIEEEGERDLSRNINLFSVILKSMQLEEEGSEDTEICEPLLPLLLTDKQNDKLSISKSQTGNPTLSALQTPLLCQKNSKVSRLADFSEMRSDCLDQPDKGVGMETGHGKNDHSLEDDEDYSIYMSR